MKNSPFIIFLFIIALAVLSGCNAEKKDTEKKAGDKICISDSLSKIIKIDSAYLSNVNDEVKLSGEVNFNDNKVVKVYPFSSGQVTQVLVSLGDKVSKGQTLAMIRSADVAGNYSDLSVANNDVAIAKKQMENTESLFKNGISSEREYIESKENYSKAVANAEKLKQQIAINGGGQTSENGSYVIRSPMTGYVVEKNAEQGSFIRGDNTQNLFTIGDISNVWIWANVYETDVAKVKEGYDVDVTTLAYPDKIFKGKVDKVNQVLDPQIKVMKVRIALKNDNLQLKPEMFANIFVHNKEPKKMITIPATAAVTDNNKSFVIVYHDRCNLELRQVEILKTVNGNSYVTNGLQVNEKVISQNQILLYRALIGE